MALLHPGSRAPNPHAPALQACVSEAVAEGAGVVRRWVGGLAAELKLQESGARSYREKTDLSEAIKALATHQAGLEAAFVGQWEQSIQEALKGGGPGQGVTVRKSLSQVRFDELELMDDDQVQATVETARVLQAVQVASDQALNELTARLSRAQGLGMVKVDHNPFRPEVAVQALSRTLESQCGSTAVRSLWLQHGSWTLAAELDVLYRHLSRLLDDMGVRPAEYSRAVNATAGSGGGGGGGGVFRGGRPGVSGASRASLPVGPEATQGFYANQVASIHDTARRPPQAEDAEPTDFQPSSLFTLSHLHRLLVSGAPELDADTDVARGDGPATGRPRSRQARQVPADQRQRGSQRSEGNRGDFGEAGDSEPLPDVYLGPDRRKRPRGLAAEAVPDRANAAQLADLAEEVVGLMLDGIAGDARLLPPVRAELRCLRPLFLRVTKEDPRFFADKHNPARCLLDEVIQQGLAFASEDSAGFGVFLDTLRQVVKGLLQADSPAAELLERALHALQASRAATEGGEGGLQAQERAVAALLKAEQRFLLAEKVAAEIRERKDYRRAPPVLQQFLSGPWSQVVASARLAPVGNAGRAGQLPADVRYTDLISDLTWSCAPEVAGRNRTRLVKVIPLLLRNLREGLHSIGYPQEKSCDFFNQLMLLQEAALKASAQGVAPVDTPMSRAKSQLSEPPAQPWVSPQESEDTGFMDLPEEDEAPVSEFVDTQPMSPANWDVSVPDEPPEAPELVLGSWIELLQTSGEWQRARLVWASPHGTMYLFSVNARPSISMTRRNFEALILRKKARCVAVQSVVDDALDHVMDTAVRNSVARGG